MLHPKVNTPQARYDSGVDFSRFFTVFKRMTIPAHLTLSSRLTQPMFIIMHAAYRSEFLIGWAASCMHEPSSAPVDIVTVTLMG